MRRYDVISEICDAMLELGWGPYQNDHEDANGQFEMNWQFADALVTADRMAFFKYMVKAIAEKHGLRATFMPKPFVNLTGSGCHVHVSLWQGDKNLFDDGNDGLGLSRTALQLHRRVDERGERALLDHQSDGELLQAHQCAGDDLRRHLVAQHRDLCRQQPHPHDPRSRAAAASSSGSPTAPPIPICCPPRSLPPASTASRAAPIPASRSTSTCTPRATRRRPAPRSCRSICSTRCASPSARKLLRRELGDEFVNSYIKLKTREWNDYSRHLTEWERANTLDC